MLRAAGIACFFVVGVIGLGAPRLTGAADLNLSRAVVGTRGDQASPAERTAAIVLIEEVAKRSDIAWDKTETIGEGAPAIVVTASLEGKAVAKVEVSEALRERVAALKSEGFCIYTEHLPRGPIVWIVGADERGALYGVGYFLRKLALKKGAASCEWSLDVSQSPAYPLRGHQLGYRDRANSWDAWDDKQFDQYIRELALFGANAIENIPFQDDSPIPHAKLPREQINQRISEICQRYGLEHWVWVPADFDLADEAKRAKALDEHEKFYAACARLDGVFVPGGDPGDNHPRLVIPFLEDLAKLAQKKHPAARVWLSMQGFDKEQVDFVYDWIGKHEPTWLGGLVHGPSSPSLAETRRRLPAQYPIRHYPDITHCVRCQYPIAWWDPAFACTLGREPINPTPTYQKQLHNAFAPWTNGFLSYSDGVHDDVNKVIWTQLAWDPNTDVREILIDYARLFFGADVAPQAADGILALEKNWGGPAYTNGGIEATLAFWQKLEQAHPLPGNWRWEMCLLRAYYDADVRQRLIFESELENEVNRLLGRAEKIGADTAIKQADEILKRAIVARPQPQLESRVKELCDALFKSIGLQTSVEKYQAAGWERGAVLDFLNYPLNNRYWLEDQFAEIQKLASEKEKLARLDLIRTWEHPGAGSFYDDVGHPGKSPHVVRGETPDTDPAMRRNPNPDYWEAGKKRARQSWYTKMDWPAAMRYDGLDPNGRYTIRTTGFGQCLLKIDGQRVAQTLDGKEVGEFKEFSVPQDLLKDGTILLTFDVPEESHLNWRQQSRLTELWLLKGGR